MLYVKELKKVMLSISVLLYIIALFAIYFTQFVADNSEPIEIIRPGDESSETVIREMPEQQMAAAAQCLVEEYLQDTYVTYPFGLYKEVKLKEKKKQQMEEILAEITGNSVEDGDIAAGVSPTLTYERFRELMDEADRLLGGGSQYEVSRLANHFSRVPMTYEEWKKEYEDIFLRQKITPAYARLFCDYLGIVLSLMPVFVTASQFFTDRKHRISELIYTREISSARIVVTRYLAAVSAMIIPVLLLVIHGEYMVWRLYPGEKLNWISLPLYALGWLVPNILFAASLGAFLTELYSPILAVFVQGILWVGSINATSVELTGKIARFSLIVRHNSLYEGDLFAANFDAFVINRIFYILVSGLMLGAAVLVYQRHRERGIRG